MKKSFLYLTMVAVTLSSSFIGYKMSPSFSKDAASILMSNVESLACNGEVTPFDLKDNYLALVTCILPWQQKLKCKPMNDTYCCPQQQKSCTGEIK